MIGRITDRRSWRNSTSFPVGPFNLIAPSPNIPNLTIDRTAILSMPHMS